ncbi:MAG: thiamine pyrophosphate-dependent enzyme, partial [Bacillota bacterium]|nr:thiamine pyrophosphate-dependent enzyme [Bacillota bacterium]
MSKKIIDTIRLLSAEQVEAANSGHPGLPLGAAPIAYTLYAKAMKYSPNNPKWINRDRFVLSAGHGSALLYSVLHLFSSGVSQDDLKAFRQSGSRTPGHPEMDITAGVDISTGPLGQGIANAVGFALAEAKLAQKFNQDDFKPIDHYTYVLHGDGCLMEGVAYEAASLAGHLGLRKLIMLYDSNNITIEGDTEIALSEDIRGRFESMGWDYFSVEDGNDVEAIAHAVEIAKTTDKPSLIEVKTKIGYGAKSVEGTAKAHGAPLGEKGMQELYQFLGISDREPFHVEESVYVELQELRTSLNAEEAAWHERMKEYRAKYPQLGAEFDAWTKNAEDIEISMDYVPAATRVAGGVALNKVFEKMPNLVGGSADLAPTNGTELKTSDYISKGHFLGANIHFGVREHGMGAIVNGMLAH